MGSALTDIIIHFEFKFSIIKCAEIEAVLLDSFFNSVNGAVIEGASRFRLFLSNKASLVDYEPRVRVNECMRRKYKLFKSCSQLVSQWRSSGVSRLCPIFSDIYLSTEQDQAPLFILVVYEIKGNQSVKDCMAALGL